MKNYLLSLLILLLFAAVRVPAQSLVSIAPSTIPGYASNAYSLTLTATGTAFTQANVQWVSLNLKPYRDYGYFLNGGSETVRYPSALRTYVDSWQVTGATTLSVLVVPGVTLTPGYYDAEVMTSNHGLLKLNAGFRVDNPAYFTDPNNTYWGTPLPPEKFNIYPSYGQPGQTLDVVVTGSGAKFDQGSTTLFIDFDQAPGVQVVGPVNRLNDTVFVARITIPASTPAGSYDVAVYTRYNGAPTLQNAFQVVTSPPTLPPGSIQGVVFKDLNKNCTQTTGEPGMAGRVVKATPGPYYAVTNANGQYNLRVPYGTYNVNRLADEFVDPVCQLNGLTTAVNQNAPTATGRNFADTTYTCRVDLILLGTNLPPGSCFNTARASIRIQTRTEAIYEIYYVYYDNGRPWYSRYGWGDLRVPSTQDIGLDLNMGDYMIAARTTEGNCVDTLLFSITENVQPTCQVSVQAVKGYPYTVNPECGGGPRYAYLSAYGRSFCYDQPTVNVYRRTSGGTFEYYGQASYTSNSYPYANQRFFISDSGLYRLEAVGVGGCKAYDSLYVGYEPCAEYLFESRQLSQSERTLVGNAQNTSCSLNQVSIRRLETNQVVATTEVYGYFSFPNLVNGTYEVTAVAKAGRCQGATAKDTVTIYVPVNWPITFGNTGEDAVRGIVRDAQGNVYASITFSGSINLQGTTIQAGTKRDALLAKFNDNGDLLWARRIGNNTFNTEPRGVNLDGQGNPVWAGSFAGSVTFPNGGVGVSLTAAGSYDAFVARFDPATGNCTWARRVGGAGNDYLYACFVSNSGNVYAGGSYTGTIQFQTGTTQATLQNAGGLDGFIVKFDANGTGLYASRMGSTANDEVKSIEYMGGDLVACGYMGNNTVFPAGTNSAPSSITLSSISGSRDGFAGRVNSEGRFVWVKNFGTIYNDEAQSICLDPSTGNVFAAAQVADAPMVINNLYYPGWGNNDIAVVGWNFYTQAFVWAKRVGSTGGDVPTSLRWDGERLALAGYMSGTIQTSPGGYAGYGGQDALLLRFNKTNGQVSSASVSGGSGNDQALALWCNTSTREAFLGGFFSGTATITGVGGGPRTAAGSTDGFLTRILAPANARQGEEEEASVLSAAGLRAYPQPVAAGSKLTVVVATEGHAQLMDMQGRRLATLRLQPGQNTLDAPKTQGLYLLKTADGVLKIIVE